jgi:putative addiction module CopG family antidote
MHAILSASPLLSYDLVMDDMTLPPELERFAAEAIAAGRYRDKADLLAAGVSLLQRQERARAALLSSALAAKEEGDRDGYLTGDEVAARVRVSIVRRSATPA